MFIKRIQWETIENNLETFVRSIQWWIIDGEEKWAIKHIFILFITLILEVVAMVAIDRRLVAVSPEVGATIVFLTAGLYFLAAKVIFAWRGRRRRQRRRR